MNTLPDIMQDRIFKYKHELGYKHVMHMLKESFGYCGWCGKWMLIYAKCRDCWDEDENTMTLFKIHCSRCGDATFMEFVPDYCLCVMIVTMTLIIKVVMTILFMKN